MARALLHALRLATSCVVRSPDGDLPTAAAGDQTERCAWTDGEVCSAPFGVVVSPHAGLFEPCRGDGMVNVWCLVGVVNVRSRFAGHLHVVAEAGERLQPYQRVGWVELSVALAPCECPDVRACEPASDIAGHELFSGTVEGATNEKTSARRRPSSSS